MKRNEALAEYRRKLDAGEIESPVNRTPRERLDENPKSLRNAINCFCFECVGEIKNDVKHCTVKNCPLWHVRPWQKKTDDIDLAKETDT